MHKSRRGMHKSRRGMHKSRRGRHQINLFNVLKGDLDKRGLLLKDIDDLFNLRILAKDRMLWKEYYDKV